MMWLKVIYSRKENTFYVNGYFVTIWTIQNSSSTSIVAIFDFNNFLEDTPET